MAESQRQRLRVLILEDNDADAALVLRQLKQAGFDPEFSRVQNESGFAAALNPSLDVILADFHLPTFSAPEALEVLKQSDVQVPLIVVSGSIGEETAVEVLHRGAADYLLKDRLTRLGPAVQRAIDQRRLALEKQKAEDALRESEERTRFALTAARLGVWEVDFPTNVARWSETLEVLHGLAPGTFKGTFEAFLDRVHPDDRAEVATSITRRRRTESTVVYRTVWPDGTTHWISTTGRTFFDAADTPVRAAGVGLDVTEQRTLEEQYRQSQKVESIGQLAGGIAHDFNNLLTAIQGYCELLREEVGLSSPHQHDLNEIRLASERAAALTRQLLAFSRRQILEPRVFDLRSSLHEMESMLRRLIGENLKVTVKMTDETSRIKADPGQVEQVILNLALNARDAMPNGGSLMLEVRTAELDDSSTRRHLGASAGRYVMLCVSDTGVGMDDATQARIFEPFFTTKSRGHGTGLGLSTVYGIVKQSGGDIWVYSEPGRGTTFKIYFPRVEEAVDPRSASAVPAVLAGSETILVVEDETAVRELVRKSLERHGYRILVAATPSEAIELAEHYVGHIDLMISDVVLPEMSGRTLADHLAQARPEMRVMYVSGYTDHAIVQNGALDPDTPFLQKPFTPDALARKVRTVLI